MGLHVTVIGNSDSPVKGYTLTNTDGPFNPSEDYPAAELRKGPFGTIHIIPEWTNEFAGTGIGPMFDGNFAYSHDSRFSKAVQQLTGERAISHAAIAIHDRIETPEMYDILSR